MLFVINSHGNHMITLNSGSNKWQQNPQFICQNMDLRREKTMSQLIRKLVIRSNSRRHVGNMGGHIFCIFMLCWKLVFFYHYTRNMHTNYAYYTFLIFRLNYKYSDVFGLTVEYLVYRILININVLIIVLLTVF